MKQAVDNYLTTLPSYARLSINRCNLPAHVLGSLTFQQHPTPLIIDGVKEFHADFFERLDKLLNPYVRTEHFMDYMTVFFRLDQLEDVGFNPESRIDRSKANYLRLIRGWFFNPDGQEAAVLKGWVESRFGLIPRFHKEPIRKADDDSYRIYEQERALGLYNTNSLEQQLDLLYSFCQFELKKRLGDQTHITLYRGCNQLSEYESVDIEKLATKTGSKTILLNNINSFSSNGERADEFGDYIIKTEAPLEKIMFFKDLLPNVLQGEDEHIVLGGVYNVEILSSTI